MCEPRWVRTYAALLIVLTNIVTAVPTGATPAMPEAGARIRLTALVPERERWIGPFVSLARDTVTMRDEGPSDTLVTVPALRVTRFEISQGNHGNGLRGAGVGLGIGALLGAAIGAAGTSDNDYIVSRGAGAAAGALLLGVLGAGLGAVIGATAHSERWSTVPLENLRSTAKP